MADTKTSVVAGVIGCGEITEFHFHGLEQCGATISYVCDLDEKRARPWADKYKAKYTANYKDILADKTVQVIVITAITAVHKMMCIDAINAGKAVICEKTLAENADDSLEIVKLAEAKKTIFYTAYMKRFVPAIQKAKELLPGIGTIMSTHIRSYQGVGEDLWNNTPVDGFWHSPKGGKSGVMKKAGGGILTCGGSHLLDLVLFLVGRPNRLAASLYFPENRDYELRATAMIETPSNGVVNFETVWHPYTKIGFLRDGWDERIEINGTNGRLEIFSSAWNEVYTKSSLLVHYDNASGVSTEYRFAPHSPYDIELAAFCNNIADGKQGEVSRITGYEVDELIAHIRKSAAEKRMVDVQWRI